MAKKQPLLPNRRNDAFNSRDGLVRSKNRAWRKDARHLEG
jgi:hypothetical protein